MVMLNEAINIKSLGAIGDGINNDGAIFNAIPENSRVIVPYGIYRISNQLLLKNNVTLIGINKPVIILTKSKGIMINNKRDIEIRGIEFSTDTSLGFLGHIKDSSNILIDGCTFDGKGFKGDTPISTGMSTGFYVTNSINVTISNCDIKNFRTGKGIEFDDCEYCIVKQNQISRTGRAGISITSNNKNCKVIGNVLSFNVVNFTVSDGAIDMYGPNNVDTVIEENIVRNYGSNKAFGVGIRIKASSNTKCVNNTIYSSQYSFALILVQERNAIVDNGVDISKNRLNLVAGTSSNYVIRVSKGRNIKIQGNLIKVEGLLESIIGTAIEIRDEVTNLIINSNIIDSAVADVPQISSGLMLHPNGTRFENVQIKDNMFQTNSRGININLANLLVCEGNLVRTNNNVSGIEVKKSTNGYVKNNLIEQPLPMITQSENKNLTITENTLIIK